MLLIKKALKQGLSSIPPVLKTPVRVTCGFPIRKRQIYPAAKAAENPLEGLLVAEAQI